MKRSNGEENMRGHNDRQKVRIFGLVYFSVRLNGTTNKTLSHTHTSALLHKCQKPKSIIILAGVSRIDQHQKYE